MSLSQMDHRHRITAARLNIVSAAKKQEFDEAHEAHIRAKTAFITHNSDETMINLIGTWARLNRLLMQAEEGL